MNIELDKTNRFFFIGIAGTGMSAIAQYLNGIGKTVSGSDRNFGKDKKMLIEKQFDEMGISCFYQDGSGITGETEVIVVSTAIEPSNVEYQKAVELKIPVIRRAELLALIANKEKTIAVGGTSGKSTTTAMIFHILQQCGKDPSLITGAGLAGLQEQNLPGNAWVGRGEWLVIEADESDGSIIHYQPEISVLLNIEHDHKQLDDLIQLFNTFKKNTRSVFITNMDDPVANQLSSGNHNVFGTQDAGTVGKDFIQKGFTIQFMVNGVRFNIPAIGRHNMENALAAVAVCKELGVSVVECARALQDFQGIYRRTQVVGEKKGIIIIDDFAHNPVEVSSAIEACQMIGQRVIAWFQPHGFGPLRFFHRELVENVTGVMRSNDRFYMPDVFYAGGTVERNINSDVVIKPLQEKGINAFYIPSRKGFFTELKGIVEPGDIVLIMGARDTSLGRFAAEVLENIEK